MVGFPGESDRDFNQTLSLFREVRYTSAFMFAYSERTGTAAARMADQLPTALRKERLNTLIELQTAITRQHYASAVGREAHVLVTGRQDRRDRMLMGQDGGTKRVLISCDRDLTGTILPVKIVKSTGMTLIGERI
jgi:tRNA-2-methylthio-N6-dimethylallyladenosine synthase